MNDLNTLRPEVREALARMIVLCAAADKTGKWVRADCDAVIIAELLRLARDNADLREADTFGLDQQLVEYKRRVERAEAVLAEMKQTLDFRWKADMRAIEQWRAAHPGNELTWPDHADLCVWLMAELAALKSQPISGPAHDAIIRFGCGEVLSHEEMCEIVNQAVCAGRELAALKARMADACPTDRGGVNNVSSNACSKG